MPIKPAMQQRHQPTDRPAPLRVGFDVRLAHWPGIGRYIEETLLCLVRDFPQTQWVLFDNDGAQATLRSYADARLRQRLAAPNVQFVDCGVKPFSPQEPWALARVLRAAQLDVMHSPYINIPWLNANVSPQFGPRSGHQDPPLVATLHDFAHPDLALQALSPRTWAKRAYYAVLTRATLARAQHLVCVSQFLQQQLLQFQPRLQGRLSVLHHAASHIFKPLPAGQAARLVAQNHGLQGPYALFVGTFKPHKNLLALVQALADATLPPTLQLAVAAAPDPRYPQVLQAVESLGLAARVKFLGHVERNALPALYGAARVCVLPSAYESFGLPVIEAMACGTPVILSPDTALPEVGGAAAWYANPQAAPLAAALFKAFHDDAEWARRGALGLAHARQFNWQRSAARLHALYAEVVAAGPRLAGHAARPGPLADPLAPQRRLKESS